MEAGEFLHALLNDEAGATSIEYALIGALIAVAIVAAAATLGFDLNKLFEKVLGKVLDATAGIPTS